MSGKNDRKIGGIFKWKMLVLTPQASVSGIGLVPGRNYLCKLAKILSQGGKINAYQGYIC